VQSAWVADYRDQTGKRHLKTFDKKKAADAWLVRACSEISLGVHTPDSDPTTVAEAAELWIKRGSIGEQPLELSTIKQYRSYVDLHINPLIGKVRLARLTAPGVDDFVSKMLEREFAHLDPQGAGQLEEHPARCASARSGQSECGVTSKGRDARALTTQIVNRS
jgi:integrase